MNPTSVDRNLLFGLLALQNDFITRDDLLAAFASWLTDKSRRLEDILSDRGVLAPALRDLLRSLVEEHVKRHQNDPHKSLAALSSIGSLWSELESLGDAEVNARLTGLSIAGRDELDPFATKSRVAGELSSQGQRFRILRPHARGGLGEVSVALDSELNREVALKEIQDRYADDLICRDRFLLEAEITGGLEHPGIVPVYGLGHYADGRPYYAMRFIRGDSLAESIQRFHHPTQDRKASAGDLTFQSVDFRKLLGRFIDVCNAIEYAHSRGVLHRDLKPDNVMLGKYGETLIVDWGLAKAREQRFADTASDEAPLRPTPGSAAAATRIGTALGTPAYMSPEQAAGRLDRLGPASDVFCLGATLYHMLTGQPPHLEKDLRAVLRKVERGDFYPPREVKADVPRTLESVCLKAMARLPEERYSSPRALSEDIERYLADEATTVCLDPWHSRLRRWSRHHPSISASVIATSFIALISLVVGFLIVTSFSQDLADANAELETAIARERQQRHVAGSNAYSAIMNLSQHAWQSDNLKRLRELLAATVPGEQTEDFRNFEWYFWMNRAQGEFGEWKAHAKAVTGLQFSADGRKLLSFGQDAAIVWNVVQRSKLMSVESGGHPITSAHLSQDGHRLSVGRKSGEVEVWDLAEHKRLCSLQVGEKDLVVQLLRDGRRVACVEAEDGRLTLWEVQDSRKVAEWTAKGRVFSIAVVPDGHTIAVTTARSLTVLDADNLAVRFERTDIHRVASVDVVASFNPHFVVTTGYDDQGIVWNCTTGDIVARIPQRGFTEQLALSSDGTRLFVCVNTAVQAWAVPQARQLGKFVATEGETSAMALAPDDVTLAVGNADGVVRYVKAQPGEPPSDHRQLGFDHVAAALSPDGTWLAAGDTAGRVRVWSTDDGRQVRALAAQLAVEGIEWWAPLPLGRHILERPAVASIEWSPDGRMLAVGFSDHTIQIWDAVSGELLQSLKDHPFPVVDLSFSSDGNYLAAGCGSIWYAGRGALRALANRDDALCETRVWNLETGTIHSQHACKSVFAVALSPDAEILISGGYILGGPELLRWNLRKKQALPTIKLPGSIVQSIDFSPDSSSFAVCGWGNHILIYDAKSGERNATLEGHTDVVTDAKFSTDGTRLVSAASDGTIKFWTTNGFQELLTIDAGMPGWNREVSYVPEKRALASTGGPGGSVQLWQAVRDERSGANRLRPGLPATLAMLDTIILNDEAQEMVKRDVLLDDVERQQATRLVNERAEDHYELDEFAWKIVRGVDESPERYEQALRYAVRACELQTGDADYLITKGVAQYRNHEFAGATATLREALARIDRQSQPRTSNLAFLAMSLHRSGQTAEALEVFERLERAMTSESASHNAEAVGFLNEATAQIRSTD